MDVCTFFYPERKSVGTEDMVELMHYKLSLLQNKKRNIFRILEVKMGFGKNLIS